MRTKSTRKTMPRPPGTDLRPYAGRWVAIVNGHIAGIGFTADEARTAAKLSRPKEEPQVHFIPVAQPPAQAG
jgi:Family of unknown function (DUF5678)